MFTEVHFHTAETSFCGKVSAEDGINHSDATEKRIPPRASR